MDLDQKDRELLNLVQYDIPLTERPYAAVGARLGLSEDEVLERLRRLKESNIIRRMGGVFDSRKLGYKGTLCAMKVPPDKVDRVAEVVNGYLEITHNYLRDGDYNMWFTVLALSDERVQRILNEIKAATGIKEIVTLPATRIFKILVNFDVSEVNHADGTGKTTG